MQPIADAAICPSCGANWADGPTCEEAFYEMLAWEQEEPALGVVHHLLVLCFMLQHPERYSRDGLRYAIQLLEDFVERGRSPEEARQSSHAVVDSGRRDWKVTTRPGDAGTYPRPPRWALRAVDVAAGGRAGYIENVQRWARLVLAAIRAA